tara:strand:- start:831 stop:1082 length:252 start_codon:yes stop_codon:yes gene_type:complete
MSMSNYPPGFNWAAFDDYMDPMLDCGHRASAGCDCWCEDGYVPHLEDMCNSSNCNKYCCNICGNTSEEEIEICKECEEENNEE